MVYNWEIIQRWKWWYIIFFSIALFLIILSFAKWGGLYSAFSSFFVLAIIVAWYIMMYISTNKKIYINTTDDGLQIWDRTFGWEEVQWHNIEYDKNNNPKNIIFLINDNYFAHTFYDENNNILQFSEHLKTNYTPLIHNIYTWFSTKLIKMLKLW